MSQKINLTAITIIISALPFLGYIIAYTYEVNYLSIYGISALFVQININAVIIAIIYFVTLVTIFIVSLILLRPLSKKFKDNLLLPTVITWALIVSIFTLCIAFLFPEYLSALPVIIIMSALILLVRDFISPIISSRTIKNYKQNVLNRRQLRDKKEQVINFESENSHLNLFIISVLGVFFVFFLASGLGHLNALNTKHYFTFKKNNHSYALIRMYGSQMIAVRIKNSVIIPGEISIFENKEISLKKAQLKLLPGDKNSPFFPRFYQ